MIVNTVDIAELLHGPSVEAITTHFVAPLIAALQQYDIEPGSRQQHGCTGAGGPGSGNGDITLLIHCQLIPIVAKRTWKQSTRLGTITHIRLGDGGGLILSQRPYYRCKTPGPERPGYTDKSGVRTLASACQTPYGAAENGALICGR